MHSMVVAGNGTDVIVAESVESPVGRARAGSK